MVWQRGTEEVDACWPENESSEWDEFERADLVGELELRVVTTESAEE